MNKISLTFWVWISEVYNNYLYAICRAGILDNDALLGDKILSIAHMDWSIYSSFFKINTFFYRIFCVALNSILLGAINNK